ncbi:PREDICTED: uncharacterized protein LOC107354970 [Acropora digitifera]|uniref:uncharacterized protein LOC107354970 n=1 Tax=Acropora digitifera TaxID=70779 RepID=UPI00077A3CDE|nr:PREDICTED: uncharacterized protein LOC107354970 [Acropora digitifera]
MIQKCRLFAKGLKQTETSILVGLLVLISFCMGHATVNMHSFWSEPVIVWIISVITTGRCKSAFHEFLSDILDLVADKVREQCSSTKANGLAPLHLGLFDEVMSFFSTMNMYSSVKMQVSDTREYQDFLQMFTGKAKARETVTGNANFNMQRTTFTLFGFSQPFTAFPVIEDISNNAKGFTSRMLWFFPRPVFCKMRDNILDQEESNNVEHFKEQLDLYIHGETTYTIEENNKMKTVTVNRAQFFLSEEALSAFEMIHDNWELEVRKRNPHDAVVGGNLNHESHCIQY